MEENSNQKNNSAKSNNTVIVALIVVGLVILVTLKIAVNSLTNTIVNFSSAISDTNNNYIQPDYSGLEDRFDELEKKLEKQSSGMEDVNITFGECSLKDKTLEIKIKAVPKECKKDTKVTVTVGEYSSELTLKKKKYVGTVKIPYDEIYENYYFAIETDGKIKNEKVNVYDIDEEFWDWEATLYDRVGGEYGTYETETEDGKYSVNMDDAWLWIDDNEKSDNIPVLYVTMNNEVVFQQEMKYNEEEEQYEGSIDEAFDYDKEAEYVCYAEYTGESGLTYRVEYFREHYEGSEEGMVSYIEDTLTVYGADGKEIEFKYMDSDEYTDDEDDE